MSEYSPDYVKGFIDALELVVKQFRLIEIIDYKKIPDGVNALKDKEKIDNIREEIKNGTI